MPTHRSPLTSRHAAAPAVRLGTFSAFGSLLLACGGNGAVEPPPPAELAPPPALESVAYERLGGGKLAFRRISGGNYFYVIDAAARVVTALSMSPFSADPALSPDGTRIAYAASSGFGSPSAWDVSTKGLAGADSQRVSALLGQESSPSWSADGRSVYFVFSPVSATGGIYRQAVSPSPLAPTLVLASTFDPCYMDRGSPVSASAGDRLAFVCGNAVHTANADGSDRRALVSRTAPPGRPDAFYAPTWSPDAQWLAFLSTAAGEPITSSSRPTLSVRIVRADGSGARTVASMDMAPVFSTIGHNMLSLAWSPDGSRLAFNVLADGFRSHIHVVGVDGTGLVQLTTRPDALDHSLTWVR